MYGSHAAKLTTRAWRVKALAIGSAGVEGTKMGNNTPYWRARRYCTFRPWNGVYCLHPPIEEGGLELIIPGGRGRLIAVMEIYFCHAFTHSTTKQFDIDLKQVEAQDIPAWCGWQTCIYILGPE